MGQTLGTVEDRSLSNEAEMQQLAATVEVSTFERLSLRTNMSVIGADPEKLFEILGIKGKPGAGIILRMARHLTHNQLQQNIILAVSWFDGRLPKQLGYDTQTWHMVLFKAASSAELGGEPYISFEDMYELVWLLISAIDLDPTQFTGNQLEMLDINTADNLVLNILRDVKVPAVLFEQFNAKVLTIFPFLFHPIGNMWVRLFVDRKTTKSTIKKMPPENSNICTACQLISREHRATLYIALGPVVLGAHRIFQASTDGFSMHTFEQAVTSWTSSSITLVKAHINNKGLSRTKDKEQYEWPDKETTTSFTYAIYASSPWKVSSKKSFGGSGCFIIQLEPQICVWPLPPGQLFLSQSIGFGAGSSYPPGYHNETQRIMLQVKNTMTDAIFQHFAGIGTQYEHRHLFVDQVEVLGCRVPIAT